METKHRQEGKDRAKTIGFSQISGQPFWIVFFFYHESKFTCLTASS